MKNKRKITTEIEKQGKIKRKQQYKKEKEEDSWSRDRESKER